MNGANGAAGPAGDAGPAGPSATAVFDVRVELATALVGTIQSVTIPANNKPVVNFTVRDNFGRGAVGLKAATTGGTLRFNLAKLVPAAAAVGGSSEWVAYINRSAALTDGGLENQDTSERSGGTLVDNGNGTYVYTFAKDLSTAKHPVTMAAIAYEPMLTHRLGIQVSGTPSGGVGALPPSNLWFDFVPAGGAVTVTREIADEASCNGCHGKMSAHGGGRSDVQYCVTCHTPATTFGGKSVDMKVFIHKIHMGMNLPSVVAGGSYKLGNADFSHVGLPQSPANCRTCHNGETGARNLTTSGNNWRLVPSRAACGSCHDTTDFAAGHPSGVTGSPRTNDTSCASCHSATGIEAAHAATHRTTNNPAGTRLTDGGVLSEFTYEVTSVTSVSDYPVVKFRVLRDGAPMDVATLPAEITGGPSFLVAYAAPQDGVLSPIDYTQKGNAAGQPLTVTLANLRAGTAGTLSAPDGMGFVTATFTGTNKWPAGASLRAIGFQGYFSQTARAVGTAAAVSFQRPTPSVVREVTGDAKRRVVVDNARCLGCHESLQLHGGNRTDNTAICVMCHNPNLSTSGRGTDAAAFMAQVNSTTMPPSSATVGSLATYKLFAPTATSPYAPMDPLLWPEASNNFKDMIHGIHGSHIRSTPFVFVRDRGTSGVYGYDWSHVTYPQIPGNCRSCHTNTGYLATGTVNALGSTIRTTSGNPAEDRAAVLAARTSVPNITDEVTTPATAACSGCHDTLLATAHMEQNGGFVEANRNSIGGIETCSVCHGPGKIADVDVVHPIVR